MKKIRTVLVALSALYVLLTIIFLLNDESLFNRFNLLKLIDYLQAWIIVGLVLLVGVIVAGSLYIRNLKSQHKKLEKEYNAVKARLYDIEEERKAEIAQRQKEEEETERKLGAFNESLKGKEKGGKGSKPAADEINIDKQDEIRRNQLRSNPEEPDADEPSYGRPEQKGPSSDDDRPV